MSESTSTKNPLAAQGIVGRYTLYDRIAAGGMATVHIGRMIGPVGGFSRTVAIKKLHVHVASDPDFAAMLLDEARLAGRIRHPNVVSTLDVVVQDGEILLVMDYVAGETLSRLVRLAAERGMATPLPMASAIVSDVLHGLHAAHEAKSERGEPLGIVHRDVSPQNIIVGVDGTAHLLDFGVAKAVGRIQTTRDGRIKGKLAYMAPEQLRRAPVTRATDVYAASVVLWETIAGRCLFVGEDEGAILEQVLLGMIDPPSRDRPEVTDELDALVLRGLDRDPNKRFTTAREMALALERCVRPALASEVSEWIGTLAGASLNERADRVAQIESTSSGVSAPSVQTGASTGAAAMPSTAAAELGVEMRSQVSSLSVSRSNEDPRRRRGGRRIPWIVAGIALVVASAAAVLFRARDERASPVPATPVAISAANPVPDAGPSPIASTSASPAGSPAPDAPSSSATSSTPRPRPSARPATPAAREDCTVPFTVDSAGARIYKRSCL